MTGRPPLLAAPGPLVKWTERMLLDLLNRRYHQPFGNGDRWVRAEHVRSSAGLEASRTADFVAMDMWNSKGLALHGHEVKTSRSDWLCELRDPTKADEIRRYMDYWWLVVPDADIVRDDLPDGWGLMVVRAGVLRAQRTAPRLTPEPVPRSFWAPLLRAMAATSSRTKQRLDES